MSGNTIETIGVGVFILILVIGMVRMKSPAKGSDAMGAAIGEIQKVLEPRAKQIREAKGKTLKDDRQKKNGEDGGKAASGETSA